MTTVNQKEYLKKYLGIGKAPGEKKKKKKKEKAVADRLKIIDDDVDVLISKEIEDDLAAENEDAPQIVAVIDDRPPSLQIDEHTKTNLWKPIGEVPRSSEKLNLTSFKLNKHANNVSENKSVKLNSSMRIKKDSSLSKGSKDYSPPRAKQRGDVGDHSTLRKYNSSTKTYNSSKEHDNSDDRSPPSKRDDHSPPRQKYNDKSPPRKRIEDYSPPRRKNKEEDDSPPRRRNKEDNYSPPRVNYGKDSSPPRKRIKEEDYSPPRRKNKEEDDSPPRRRNKEDNYSRPRGNCDKDSSPPRKRIKEEDYSPPRRKNREDSSPPRRRYKEDSSPPRRKNREDSSLGRRNDDDNSPPRRKHTEKDASPQRRRNKKGDNDSPPPRRRNKERGSLSPIRKIRNDEKIRNKDDESNKREFSANRKDKRKSRWSPEKSPELVKTKKTLEGKQAGLQNAKDLVRESMFLKQKEDDMFKNMSADISGKDAATVVRGKKVKDLEEEAAKERREMEMKEKYEKWGKGLKQVEEQNRKMEEQLHEMNKPLARYANDEDLEKFLKEQEREGDPMLDYIRKKKKKEKVAAGIPDKPTYLGEFMPNRFGIRPGYRWDGVDRSNGYEKKWFQTQNAKLARREEAFKWNTEDM